MNFRIGDAILLAKKSGHGEWVLIMRDCGIFPNSTVKFILCFSGVCTCKGAWRLLDHDLVRYNAYSQGHAARRDGYSAARLFVTVRIIVSRRLKILSDFYLGSVATSL